MREDLITHLLCYVTFPRNKYHQPNGQFLQCFKTIVKRKTNHRKLFEVVASISSSVTSPRRLLKSRTKFKWTQAEGFQVNQEKSRLHWHPFNASMERLQTYEPSRLRIWRTQQEGWHSTPPIWLVPRLAILGGLKQNF
jgi:hypothetical protein